jgi:hypothetical protein
MLPPVLLLLRRWLPLSLPPSYLPIPAYLRPYHTYHPAGRKEKCKEEVEKCEEEEPGGG